MNAVDRLAELDFITVTKITDGWIFVSDSASGWFAEVSCVTGAVLDAYDAAKASDDDYTRCNAWTELCQDIPAANDSMVPAEVLAAARIALDDDDDTLCWGW